MSDEALDAALVRAEALVTELEGMGPVRESSHLALLIQAVKALRKVSSDGKCGYCNAPIETFASGDAYCACTRKRPCRHRYFTRSLDGRCEPCRPLAAFVAAFPEGGQGG